MLHETFPGLTWALAHCIIDVVHVLLRVLSLSTSASGVYNHHCLGTVAYASDL